MRQFLVVIFVIICALSSSCKDHLPGFDFTSFANTPVEKLAEVVKKEDLRAIEELVINDNLPVDYFDPEYGHTLLMLSVTNDLENSTQKLLELGADPNLRSKIQEGTDSSYVDTPVLIAVDNSINRKCDTKILELLIKYKGDINDKIPVQFIGANYKSIRTPLMEASKGDCLSVIKLLLESGAKLNDYDYSQGHGPLSYAIIHDQMRVLRCFIIDRKATIPPYVYVRQAYKENPRQELTLTEFLNEKEYSTSSEEFRMREEILNYLRNHDLQ